MDLWDYLLSMLTLGAKMYHHDNTKESALRIVDHILSIEGNMSLKIQQEMIEQKCSLSGYRRPATSESYTINNITAREGVAGVAE